MNADGLANVLKHTYIGDDQQRRAAEAAIKKYERMQGYPGTLLQIVVMDRFPFPVRQSATILLKNMVVRHWTVKKKLHENSIVIGEKDRGVIKRNLLEAIVTQSRQVATRWKRREEKEEEEEEEEEVVVEEEEEEQC
eukprot:jgi/Bigna1/125378/aug1.1_g86